MLADTDDAPETKLDMTPMIDCVFQLLIFFMIGCKFKSLDAKLSTHLPPHGGTEAGDGEWVPTYVRLETVEWGQTVEGRPCTRKVRIVVGEEWIGDYVQPLYAGTGGSDLSAQLQRESVMNSLRDKICILKAGNVIGDAKAPVIVLPDARIPCEDVVLVFDVLRSVELAAIGFGGHEADLERVYREDGLLFER